MVQGFNFGSPKSLLSKALLSRAVFVSFFFVGACGKSPVQSSPSDEWTLVSIVELPESLSESRLSRGPCLQIQAQSGQDTVYRLVGGRTICEANSEVALRSEEQVFEARLMERSDGALTIQGEDRTLGLIRPVEISSASTRERRRYVLAEFCQFSDPSFKQVSRYTEKCQLKFSERGDVFLGVELKSVDEIVEAGQEDREQQLSAMASLDARSKELEKRIETLGKKIRLLEGYAQNEATFADLEPKVEALRTELQLNSDATPEQIGAAVVRQGVLIRQFARELADMKKNLDLPKDASFEDVLKALRETKKRPGELEKGPEPAPPAERKEATRSPISG
jgi:hypothetical protein